MEWETVLGIAKDWRSEIEQKWPRYYDEMQGKPGGIPSSI
jgi:hypothetical protein